MTTPQPQAKKLAQALGLRTALYLKREDLHSHGSHKGRSIPLMIEKYAKSGALNFCISSSGNAAISAAITINKYNSKRKSTPLSLIIFVGKNINSQKLKFIKKLLNKNVQLQKVMNPKQIAFQMDKSGLVKNLRQSTDDTALVGYVDLVKELAKIKNLSAVFIPTSSGTTAEALYNEFKKINFNPQIHIVQTEACHPIADAVIARSRAKKQSHENATASGLAMTKMTSIAGAIVDMVAHRKEKVVEALKASKGNAWVCGNKEIKKAMALAKKTEKIIISPNSALAVAGLAQAIKNKLVFTGPVACILTGR